MANKFSTWVDQLSTKKALLLGGGLTVALVGGVYLMKAATEPERATGIAAYTSALSAPFGFNGGAGWELPSAGELFKVCAQCHDAEDVARYTKTFAPMVAMMNPMRWTDPQTFTRAMAPMIDPETYEQWYQAWAKSIGQATTK